MHLICCSRWLTSKPQNKEATKASKAARWIGARIVHEIGRHRPVKLVKQLTRHKQAVFLGFGYLKPWVRQEDLLILPSGTEAVRAVKLEVLEPLDLLKCAEDVPGLQDLRRVFPSAPLGELRRFARGWAEPEAAYRQHLAWRRPLGELREAQVRIHVASWLRRARARRNG